MAEGETFVSSSSGKEVRLIHLKLPSLTDTNIKSQVQQTHSITGGYLVLRRHQIFASISHILKPATHFVDSILLDKKVTEKRDELDNSNLLVFTSAVSKLRKLSIGFTDFDIITSVIGNAKDNIDQASLLMLQLLSGYSWNDKAARAMANFVLKFVDLLELLLHGPNQPSIGLASSMAALKENPVSLVGTPFEKYQQALDQLNSLIKMTLELIQYICGLTLLQDKEYREDLISMGVYWAILSTVVGYLQITFIMDNEEVAFEKSQLISILTQVLDDLKHHYTICKPKLEEMEARVQSNAFFNDIFENRDESFDSPIDILELMIRHTYSKDGHQSLIDGFTMSKVEIDVLKGKNVLVFISNLDIPSGDIKRLVKFYRWQSEDYRCKIVWIPFVLKWTDELRGKFKKLKSKMPWYIVCYDSPIDVLWYFNGRFDINEHPLMFLINSYTGRIQECSFTQVNSQVGQMMKHYFSIALRTLLYSGFICYSKSGATPPDLPILHIQCNEPAGAALPHLPELYMNESAEGRTKESQKAGVQSTPPSSGFQGLLAISKNKEGNKNGGSSVKF